MEKLTGKRPYRKREMLRLPEAIAEGEDASSLDNGDWKTGRDRPEPQAGAKRSFDGWIQFAECVAEIHHSKRLKTVFHPDAKVSRVYTEDGAVVVEQGDYAGILETGEKVDLFAVQDQVRTAHFVGL